MEQLTLRLSWLLAYPFRLFFSIGALWAIAAIALWVLMLQGVLTAPLGQMSMYWHAHEMLHGFAAAIIAGFLLTAMANWTGIPPATGYNLLGLLLIWLTGRVALLSGAYIPDLLLVMITPLFYLALAGVALRDLVRSGNKRNLVMPVILLVLALSSGLMTHGSLSENWSMITQGTHLSLYTLTVLMAVIAGRITPAFTRNWLTMRQKDSTGITQVKLLERLAFASLLTLAAADLLAGPDLLILSLGLCAGALHLGRLWLWRGLRVAGEPLLWILHLGYLCLSLSLIARGVIAGSDQPLSLWYHLLGVGAMGILILGVMTRVSMGHTGRPLVVPFCGLLAYMCVIAALAARMLSMLWPDLGYMTLILLTGIFWSLGFAAFLWGYLPILTEPRPDGRPG